MKHAVILLALACASCASFADVPKAADPVAQHALPVTGEALQKLADAFRVLCPVGKRPPACEAAKAALNGAIDYYTTVNNLVDDE